MFQALQAVIDVLRSIFPPLDGKLSPRDIGLLKEAVCMEGTTGERRLLKNEIYRRVLGRPFSPLEWRYLDMHAYPDVAQRELRMSFEFMRRGYFPCSPTLPAWTDPLSSLLFLAVGIYLAWLCWIFIGVANTWVGKLESGLTILGVLGASAFLLAYVIGLFPSFRQDEHRLVGLLQLMVTGNVVMAGAAFAGILSVLFYFISIHGTGLDKLLSTSRQDWYTLALSVLGLFGIMCTGVYAGMRANYSRTLLHKLQENRGESGIEASCR